MCAIHSCRELVKNYYLNSCDHSAFLKEDLRELVSANQTLGDDNTNYRTKQMKFIYNSSSLRDLKISFLMFWVEDFPLENL